MQHWLSNMKIYDTKCPNVHCMALTGSSFSGALLRLTSTSSFLTSAAAVPASHSLARRLELHTFDASVIQGYHSPKGELLSGERASDLIEPPEFNKAIGRSETDYRCSPMVRAFSFSQSPFCRCSSSRGLERLSWLASNDSRRS